MITYLAKVTLPDGTVIDDPPGFKSDFTNLSSIVTNAIPLLFSVAGLILLAYLIWGGFDYLTSMGDPKKAEAGKTKITNAVIGFFIIFAAYWITQLITLFLKLES